MKSSVMLLFGYYVFSIMIFRLGGLLLTFSDVLLMFNGRGDGPTVRKIVLLRALNIFLPAMIFYYVFKTGVNERNRCLIQYYVLLNIVSMIVPTLVTPLVGLCEIFLSLWIFFLAHKLGKLRDEKFSLPMFGAALALFIMPLILFSLIFLVIKPR
jgi:hypothetical protein